MAQEKDRRTLILLLLTHLTNSELVLGRLLASLLNVLVLLTAALPLFALITLLGGVAPGQILRASAVTLASVLVCGSLGSTIAFWREKTFQSLALTVLAMMLWLAAGQIVASGSLGASWGGIATETWAIGLSPWQAILESTRPYAQADPALGWIATPINLYLLISVGLALTLNGIAVVMVRVWNPSREEQPVSREDETWHRQSIWAPSTMPCVRRWTLPEGQERSLCRFPLTPTLSRREIAAAVSRREQGLARSRGMFGTTPSSGGKFVPGPMAGRFSSFERDICCYSRWQWPAWFG